MKRNKIIDLVNNSEYCKAAEIASKLKNILDLIRLIDIRLLESPYRNSHFLNKRSELNTEYYSKCIEIQKYPRRVRGIIQSFVKKSEDPYDYIIKYINTHKNEIVRD